MKHFSSNNLQHLRSWAEEVGVHVSQEEAGTLLEHLELVIEANKKVNLTRITSTEDALRLHLVDSLALLPYLSSLLHHQTQARYADLGTGAGFPGIPLAVMSTYDGVLIESVQKKASAVGGFINQLGLEDRVSVFSGRAEELAVREPESFDFVVARAVAPLNVLLELGSPLLKKGGVLFAMKANVTKEEAEAASGIASYVGFGSTEVFEFELPLGKETRKLYCYIKTTEPAIPLPRRIGKAQKSPLKLGKRDVSHK